MRLDFQTDRTNDSDRLIWSLRQDESAERTTVQCTTLACSMLHVPSNGVSNCNGALCLVSASAADNAKSESVFERNEQSGKAMN